jgi:hypothetical protein
MSERAKNLLEMVLLFEERFGCRRSFGSHEMGIDYYLEISRST